MMLAEPLTHPNDAFATIDVDRLEAADYAVLDALPFGVIGLSPDGLVEIYSAKEVEYSGMRRESVLGRPFFLALGMCMNNVLVAERFEAEATLDTVIDYVLTFRMRRSPVQLRMLKRPGVQRRYLLVQR